MIGANNTCVIPFETVIKFGIAGANDDKIQPTATITIADTIIPNAPNNKVAGVNATIAIPITAIAAPITPSASAVFSVQSYSGAINDPGKS